VVTDYTVKPGEPIEVLKQQQWANGKLFEITRLSCPESSGKSLAGQREAGWSALSKAAICSGARK